MNDRNIVLSKSCTAARGTEEEWGVMAPNFKLAIQVPLIKTVIIESRESQKTAQEKKEEQLKAKKGRKNLAELKAAQAKREKDQQEQII